MKRPSLHISKAPSLAAISSIRLGGEALALVQVENETGLELLPSILSQLGGTPVMLGQGSNVLAGSGSLPLVLVALSRGFARQEILFPTTAAQQTLIEVSAALPLPLLLNRMAETGLGGLSGLAGIPGRVGGAVAMNAGSFGYSIKDRLHAVRLFSPSLGTVTLNAEELEIGYRHFSVPSLRDAEKGKNWFFITSVIFNCSKQSPAEIKKHMNACLAQKRRSQPLGQFSAGCIFKNPAEAPAGKLLEECGFKGRTNGGISFSAIHANFLINNGRGRSEEALELIEDARNAVRARHGLNLELEVQLWL